MRKLTVSLAALAVIASPVLAQQQNNTMTEKSTTPTTTVKTTTKHIHATNVPVRHHRAKRHHMVRCGCPSTHMKTHHMKTHHVVKKTTTTTTTKS